MVSYAPCERPRAIAYGGFKAESAIPPTLDLISSRQHTVLGQGVTLAFALGVILSLIAAKAFARHVAKSPPELSTRVSRPWSALFKISVGNAMALFGWFVALAVLWQRFFGAIEVSPLFAAVLVDLLAALITVVVEVRTENALLRADFGTR